MKSFGAVVILICLGMSAFGCGDNNAEESPIPDSLLVGVLVDVYSATARAHLDGTDASMARVEALARFGLDTTDFNRTLTFLAENPDSAASVYQRALDSLIVVEQDLRSAPDLDSLQKHIRG